MAGKRGRQGELFEGAGPPEGTVVVNGRCSVQTRDGFRVATCAGVPLRHYAVGDRMAEAHAIVSLVDQGWATQVEAAAA